jgi:PAS domain S-box-containing protein
MDFVLRNEAASMMSNVFVSALFFMAGLSFYAAMHHGLIALRRPIERTHLLFALLCLAVALYIVIKATFYHADSVPELISLRRWEASLAMVIFIVFSWFVSEYTGVRPLWLLVGLSGFLLVVFAANLLLPYGAQFVDLPRIGYITLPWGERLVDDRVHQRSGWHNAGYLGALAAFAYSIFASIRQYRQGARRRALTLALGTSLFLVFVLFNRIANHGLVESPHLAQFGYLAMIAVMNQGLTRELREGERRMRAVLDNVPAVVYLKDLDGCYLMVNRRFEELFHMSGAAVAGKTDHELFPAEQADSFRANDRRVLESRQPMEFEETGNRNGEQRWYTSLKFPLLDSSGRVTALCGVSMDVTEARKIQDEMRILHQRTWHTDRIERAGAITVSLAHELSQPLTAILSNAQAGLRYIEHDADPSELRDILQDIVRDDKRAASIINGLRAMLRKQDTMRENIELGTCVSETLELIRGVCMDRGIDCKLVTAEGCRVLVNAVQIQQVVLNLVMNAMEAMADQLPEHRVLTVSMSRAGTREAVVAVRDSGIGISYDVLDKVFDGFYTTKAQGLGIGLAVCRTIVEAHGGRIWVAPNDGRGVTFFFALPLDEAIVVATAG